MTNKKTIKRTKSSVEKMTSGLTNVALAGAGATLVTGLGAGLLGAARLHA